jgi:trehalose 6-phosphate synthase/phosphatase
MNLVSKEYIASRTDYEGMVVISETAGAVSELGEAVIVNPNDNQAIADGIKTALEMPREEQIRKNKILHKRLQYYNVNHWADEFLRTLTSIGNDPALICKDLNQHLFVLQKDYQNAQKRIFFLDYDGTLVGIKAKPEWAQPDHELKELMSQLTADPKNTVVIISGRDRHTLGKWFSELRIHLVADHGLWIKNPDEDWNQTVPIQNDWKDSVRSLLEVYSDRFPGSFIEEKEYSLAFHYRNCDPYMIEIKLGGLRDELLSMISSLSLGLQEGKKVIEVKDLRVSKGLGASILLQNKNYDFIFGAGDDLTDEDLFLALPENAYGTKIGEGNSKAPYFLKSWKSLRSLLNHFAEISKEEMSIQR